MYLKVLLIEDSQQISSRITKLLSLIEGLEIENCSASAEDAFSVISEKLPDVVILDTYGSEGEILNLIAGVKRQFPETVIILFTNYMNPQYKRLSILTGADYYVDKYSEFEKLPEILKKLQKKNLTQFEMDACLKAS